MVENMPSITKSFYDFLVKPSRFDYIHKYLKRGDVQLLDVGCGNHSCLLTKKYYPKIKYYGIDMVKDYNKSKEDYDGMENFYLLDISKDMLHSIPNDYFDVIIFSHVIEHMENGEEVLERLISKLKKGGIIYIETPSPHSGHMPKPKNGTLNFYQDPTHVRIYPVKTIERVLFKNNFVVLKKGLKLPLRKIIFSPIIELGAILKGYFNWEVIADITGFASYVVAKKE